MKPTPSTPFTPPVACGRATPDRRARARPGLAGFTLIEILVGLGIVAILAAIAVPVYQSYVTRSRVTEALVFADAARTPVQLAVLSGTAAPTDLLGSGAQAVSGLTAVQWVPGTAAKGTVGAIVANMTLPGLGSRAVLALEWRVKGGWHCLNASGYAGGGAWLADSYLPESCRGNPSPMAHVLPHDGATAVVAGAPATTSPSATATPSPAAPSSVASAPAGASAGAVASTDVDAALKCEPHQVAWDGRCQNVCSPGFTVVGNECQLVLPPAALSCLPNQIIIQAINTCVDVCQAGYRVQGNRCERT